MGSCSCVGVYAVALAVLTKASRFEVTAGLATVQVLEDMHGIASNEQLGSDWPVIMYVCMSSKNTGRPYSV